MKFEKYPFSQEVKKNISDAGLKRPTDIQYKSITPILNGDDVLAVAQTGTGKTAAFAIPVIDILHKQKRSNRSNGIKCIVMAPTRELALQITEVFQQMAKSTKVKTLCVFGGVDQDPQIDRLQKGIDVLVATPGRMFDLVSQGHIKLDKIEVLILDEADHMLDLGFIKDIKDLIKFLPRKRQTLFFSATINKKIKSLAYSLVNKPVRIQISPKDPVSKNVSHFVTYIEPDHKRFFLERMVSENPDSKILVFVRTKIRAERVCKAMARVNIEALTIHGDKDQQNRLDVLTRFKEGEVKVLIATDVSARGIDIPKVDFVVNYDLPEQAENYVHRIGRTGRAKHKGQAVSFCSKEELSILDEIETYLDKPITELEFDNQTYQETIDFTSDHTNDWKSLMKEFDNIDFDDSELKKPKAKNKKKKKKAKKK
ncbi:DEAD/DEAH box helicase [Puteibacter caeruleilacunae]|nr:DEAD/DEAH box helicase [Puteibacter caeruleilacunae]